MANKLALVLVILVVLYAAGVGVYTYTLNWDIDKLGERFSTLEAEQTSRLDALDTGLTDFQNETLDNLDVLGGLIIESIGGIASIRDEISDINAAILDINSDILDITSGLGVLDERITNIENELTAYGINAEVIYEQVSAATVRISDGELTRGSGVIMDRGSHVITAQHVIDGLTEIYVVTYDGLVTRATLVGECEFSDIAVLELVKAPDVNPPTFADSSLINPGARVLAIGTPRFDITDESEMRDTLTEGIISQVNRYIKYNGKLIPNLLQFDASVNPVLFPVAIA